MSGVLESTPSVSQVPTALPMEPQILGLNSENHLRVRPKLNGSRSQKYRGREKSHKYRISEPSTVANRT